MMAPRSPPLMCLAALAAVAVSAAAPTVGASPPADASLSHTRGSIAFQPPSLASRRRHRSTPPCTVLRNDNNNEDAAQSSFLSTSKASVAFKGGSNAPSNLSPVDQLLLAATSDKTSLLLGSAGILLLLLNRLVSFPEDAVYEASRSRVDLLGVFAAGSVLLNGITKLDVESVQAERVALEGVNEDEVVWTEGSKCLQSSEKFRSTAEWALASFLRCSPARTAVLLAACPEEGQRWTPIATMGIVPTDPDLRKAIPEGTTTPILDRMLRNDGSIKGGTVGGTDVLGATRKGPKESYLPTLQALPGRVEFTYLPGNAQEVLLLPVQGPTEGAVDGRYYAVVLGGDTAKSFAPRDIAWCREIAAWIGEVA
ncbi:hypothetical protein ACHAXT_001474 [Thalassiosira profunda]